MTATTPNLMHQKPAIRAVVAWLTALMTLAIILASPAVAQAAVQQDDDFFGLPSIESDTAFAVNLGDGLELDGACGRVVASFVAPDDDFTITATDDESWFAIYSITQLLGDENSLITDAVLEYDNCAGEWDRVGSRHYTHDVTLEAGVPYWIAWGQEDNQETFAINGSLLLEFVPEWGGSIEFGRGAPIVGSDYQNRGVGDLQIEGCTSRSLSVIARFTAIESTTYLSGDREAAWAILTLDTEVDNATVDDLTPAGECRSRWVEAEVGVVSGHETVVGEEYYLAMWQEDQFEQYVLNPTDSRYLPSLEFSVLDADSLPAGFSSVVGERPFVSHGECPRRWVLGSFVATDTSSVIWASDNEVDYSLYVIDGPVDEAGLDDLVPVDGCVTGEVGDVDPVTRYVDGWGYVAETEPGVRYWLGVEQEDFEVTWIVAPTEIARETPVLFDGVEFEVSRGQGVPLEGACGNVVAGFEANSYTTRFTTSDNENHFALYTIDEHNNDDDVALAYDNCDGVWESVPDGNEHVAATVPGTTYLIVWDQEDNAESFTINAPRRVDFVPELTLDEELVRDEGNAGGPQVTVGDCVQTIVGSFVAADAVTYVNASDNEVNWSLLTLDETIEAPTVRDLVPATGCRAGWTPAFEGQVSRAFTEPGERYYLALFQEDVVESYVVGTTDILQLPQPALINVSCLVGNGRVDVNLQNHDATEATYVVQITGLSARSRVVDAYGNGRISVTGRSDGTYDVAVERDGVEIMTRTIEINCDDPNQDVVGDTEISFSSFRTISTCRNGLGFVQFQFTNKSALAASWVIEFDGVPNRSTSASPWGQALRGTSGRPNGEYQASIYENGQLIGQPTIAVACP